MSPYRTVIESHSGDSIILDPVAMTVGHNYDYRLEGRRFRAVLNADGSIEIFELTRPGIWSVIRSQIGGKRRSS